MSPTDAKRFVYESAARGGAIPSLRADHPTVAAAIQGAVPCTDPSHIPPWDPITHQDPGDAK
jgi:hypothetical protein